MRSAGWRSPRNMRKASASRAAPAPARRRRLRIRVGRRAAAAATQRQHETDEADRHQREADRLEARIGSLRPLLEHQIDLADVDAVSVPGPGRESVDGSRGVDRVDHAGAGPVNEFRGLRGVVAGHRILEGQRRGQHRLAVGRHGQRQHGPVLGKLRHARRRQIEIDLHRRIVGTEPGVEGEETAYRRIDLPGADRHVRQVRRQHGIGRKAQPDQEHQRGEGQPHALRSQRRSGVCCQ